MNKNLFDDSDDNASEENFQLKTNENYAKTYNTLRKNELAQKFKDKGLAGSESDSDESSSSEEDEQLDPEFDQHFLNTLASLKSKDPSIYDKNIKFFKGKENSDGSDGEDAKNKINKEKKAKPVTLKDYERKIILEQGGKYVDDSDEDADNDKGKTVGRAQSPTLVEEERRLKAEFRKVVDQNDDTDEEEFGGIFKKRVKTKAEEDKEEEDYLKWLAGKDENIGDDVKQKLEPLKQYWSSSKLPSSEKFLRDYILNKGYTNASNYNEIPTYEEIVGDQAPLSEDEKELETQAEFEQKYNFRFEEPDQEFIKRYPRTIQSSLRLTEEKRKKKRQEIKERKLQEKQEKLKELEIVKEMKRKEIQEKIEKLKMVTGNDELGFKDDDLEEDFDPDAHDRRMQELFNDDYYQIDEGEEKPQCPSDIEELKVEDWDNYNPQQDEDFYENDNDDPHCEDEDFNMDCDYDPAKAKEELQKELIDNTRKRRGGRKGRRDHFMEIIKTEKPVFDPEDEKTYGEYIDEYYKLDCEDVIGDTPCRFKYVETTPNDFGLTIEEILLAKNKELNQWASLKKATQIRPEHVEKKEQRLYKSKSKNEELKRKIFKSLYGEGSDNENEEEDQTNKNKSNTKEVSEANSGQGESKKSKKKRKRKMQTADSTKNTIVENTTENTHKIDNPTKKSKTNPEEPTNVTLNVNQAVERPKSDSNKKKKKKKNSNKTPEKLENVDKKEKNTQNSSNSQNDDKPFSKNNPFAKGPSQTTKHTKQSVGTLPPLRNNSFKQKSNNNFKSKFKNKTPFSKKFKSQGDSKNISDERLKAYGINPRKFHNKQKYGKTK